MANINSRSYTQLPPMSIFEDLVCVKCTHRIAKLTNEHGCCICRITLTPDSLSYNISCDLNYKNMKQVFTNRVLEEIISERYQSFFSSVGE